MSTNFQDNFSTYSPGSTNINGFVWEFGGSPVVAFDTMTGSSSAEGFYERMGQGLQIVGGVINEQVTPSTHCQVNFMHWGGPSPNNFTNILSFDNANLSTGTDQDNPSYQSVMWFGVNLDYTVSMVINSTYTGGSPYAGGPFVVTSDQQAYFPYTWNYYQINCTFFDAFVPVVTGTTTTIETFVGVTGTLAMDGTVVLVGTATTSLNPATLWTTDANINQYRFPGAFGYTRFLGDMASYTDADIIPFGSYAFGVTPIHVRYTQSVVELGRTPSTRNARMTQGVVEIPRAPSQRNIRMTQGVVEIIRKGLVGGWYVYEA